MPGNIQINRNPYIFDIILSRTKYVVASNLSTKQRKVSEIGNCSSFCFTLHVTALAKRK